MNNNAIISKIKELKEIKPSQEWLFSFREQLADQAEIRQKAGFFNIFEAFSFQFKPAYAALGVLMVILGGPVALAKMAKSSLPGDILFPIKLVSEKIQLKITTNSAKKSQLEAEIFSERVKELSFVLSNPIVGGDQSRVETAANEVQKQLVSAKAQLNIADKNVDTVAVARTVGKQAAKAQQVLRISLSAKSASNGVSEKITEVSEIADKTEMKALEILVNNADKVDSKEIAANIGGKIDQTSQVLKTYEEKAADKTVADKISINASLILDQSQKALDEAKVSLKKDDLTGALDKYKVSQELVKGVANIVESASSTPATK